MLTAELLLLSALVAGQPSETLFRQRIAPLLEQRCVGCHNADKTSGGLDLSTSAGFRKGSDSGSIMAREAEKSLLLQVVSGPKPRMPRAGEKLSSAEIALLRKWIESGAAWPEGLTLRPRSLVSEPVWWSLRPLSRPTVPTVADRSWVRTPIDAFVLARLEANRLQPAPEADRRTLLRRLCFDLTGLPPTPEQMSAFLADPHPDAYERLVDSLLGSPAYGERWGRHWLDVARYADTHGYDKDKRRDHAWPYRDWVIDSLNADQDYRSFIRDQLAGDVLRPGDPRGVMATGFVVAGPWDFVGHVELREGTVDKEKTRVLDRDDMVSSILGTLNSLTVGCARCHDHKFDPIPMRDYYRLQAVFAGVERANRVIPGLPNNERNELAQQRAAILQRLVPHLLQQRRQLQTQIQQTEQRLQKLPTGPQVYAVSSIPPRPIWVLHRGDVENRRAKVTPGTLSCLESLPADLPVADNEPEGKRRLALANWITDDRNVLTWRSIVNRVWHYHFGKGLVDTPNDFGRMGGLPSHPELLDWLATEFRQSPSLKRLHRLIVLSSVYRQSSRHNEAAARIDSDNRLLWRMNRLRLDAETLRDSVLAVSGQLDRRQGGPGYDLFRFKDDHSPVYDHFDVNRIHDPTTYRRTVYRFTVRSVPNPFLDCLDCADPNQPTPVRNTTLTALQALALLNNPFMVRQSLHLAERLAGAGDEPAQVRQAYALLFTRSPSEEELRSVSEHIRRHGLAATCRILLNTNEFLFVD